jgi:hypothetical protein
MPKERNTNDLFEARTMKSVLLDAMLKYNGWAAMSSYMSRTTLAMLLR